MGVERSDVISLDDGRTIHGDPKLLEEHFLDKYAIDYGVLLPGRRAPHIPVA